MIRFCTVSLLLRLLCSINKHSFVLPDNSYCRYNFKETCILVQNPSHFISLSFSLLAIPCNSSKFRNFGINPRKLFEFHAQMSEHLDPLMQLTQVQVYNYRCTKLIIELVYSVNRLSRIIFQKIDGEISPSPFFFYLYASLVKESPLAWRRGRKGGFIL